jgi:hypothetical protein
VTTPPSAVVVVVVTVPPPPVHQSATPHTPSDTQQHCSACRYREGSPCSSWSW